MKYINSLHPVTFSVLRSPFKPQYKMTFLNNNTKIRQDQIAEGYDIKSKRSFTVMNTSDFWKSFQRRKQNSEPLPSP